MDTRKLRLDEHMGLMSLNFDDGSKAGPDILPEIVKRWNAYLEHIQTFEKIAKGEGRFSTNLNTCST